MLRLPVHEDNRKRFAMSRNRSAVSGEGFARPTSQMSMADAVRMGCGETDIIAATKNPSIFATHEVDPTTPPEETRFLLFMCSLQAAASAADFQLLPIQAKAIYRVVYRPSSTLTFARAGPAHAGATGTLQTMTYRTPYSDVLSPVIIDMPTGSGKTITAMLGAVLFAIERKDDMQATVMLPPTPTGVAEVTGVSGWDPSSPPVSSKCMVFTPHHLVEHWIRHGAIAKRIVEHMLFADGRRRTVRIAVNQYASDIDVGPDEVLIIICDSSRCGVKKFLQPSVHYSSVCFDEVSETDSKMNALCQTMPRGISHGRFILVSADLYKWRHGFDVRSVSVLRHIFPTWRRPNFTCAGTYNYQAAATCRTSAIFSVSERATTVAECTRALQSAVLDIACVEYRPSLAERLGGGCDLFHEKYGVDVSHCSTLQDIVLAIRAVIADHEGAARNVNKPSLLLTLAAKINELNDMERKIIGVRDEECPICYERMTDVALIHPCLHVTCKGCMSRLGRICPMCRGQMAGTIDVSTGNNPAKRQRTSGPGERIGSLFFDELAALCGPSDPIGVVQAIGHVLRAVQRARETSPRCASTLRTMMICPGANVGEGLYRDMGFEVLRYNARNVHRGRETLNRFAENDGSSKLLCVRDDQGDDGKDCVAGLDIPNLDCVISVGGTNFSQRVGLLCRLSRMALSENERHALYVDIVPKME